MKKTYTKPSIQIEKFCLSQSIASGCGASSDSTLGRPSHGDKATCGWDMGNLVVWTGDGSSGCNWPWGVDERFDSVCYNNPNGGMTIFGS